MAHLGRHGHIHTDTVSWSRLESLLYWRINTILYKHDSSLMWWWWWRASCHSKISHSSTVLGSGDWKFHSMLFISCLHIHNIFMFMFMFMFRLWVTPLTWKETIALLLIPLEGQEGLNYGGNCRGSPKAKFTFTMRKTNYTSYFKTSTHYLFAGFFCNASLSLTLYPWVQVTVVWKFEKPGPMVKSWLCIRHHLFLSFIYMYKKINSPQLRHSPCGQFSICIHVKRGVCVYQMRSFYL